MQIENKDILQTGNLELLARKAVEGFITGYHKSPFHGFSVEFAEHRQYHPGDSIKNIDWKLYGKTDRLYSKRFEEETNLRCQLVIDASSSMQMPNPDGLTKLQFSIWCCAVLLNMLKRQRDAGSLCLFDNKILEMTKVASSGRHHRELIQKLDQYLGYSSDQKTTDISNQLHLIAEQMHRRSMIVLFTDFFELDRNLEKVMEGFQHMKYNKHEIIVFYTINKAKEIEFEYPSVPTTFIDVETGEKLRVQPSSIKDSYVKSMENYVAEIKLRMHQYKIDFIKADINKDISQILIPFLIKRRNMG